MRLIELDLSLSHENLAASSSPRWLAIFKFNQTSYVTSLSMGDYLLWCKEVLAIIRLVYVDGNQFFEPKMVNK